MFKIAPCVLDSTFILMELEEAITANREAFFHYGVAQIIKILPLSSNVQTIGAVATTASYSTISRMEVGNIRYRQKANMQIHFVPFTIATARLLFQSEAQGLMTQCTPLGPNILLYLQLICSLLAMVAMSIAAVAVTLAAKTCEL
jgi:subtilase family serine protease